METKTEQTIKEIQAKINDLQMSLDKLSRGEQEEKEYLKEFKEGDKCYFPSAYDEKCFGWSFFGNKKPDIKLSQSGTFFTKEEHAKIKSEHVKKWGLVERLLIEFNDGWEPDWSNENQKKGVVEFDHHNQQWGAFYVNKMEYQCVICFEYERSDELLYQLNKHFPKGV